MLKGGAAAKNRNYARQSVEKILNRSNARQRVENCQEKPRADERGYPNFVDCDNQIS